MNHLPPIPPNTDPDFVPADGPDNPAKRSGNGPLWLLIIIPILYGIFTLGAWSQNHAPQPPSSGPYANAVAAPPSKLTVQVTGAVLHPGLYQLPFNARVDDAVRRAGPLPDADINALNLAEWAEDGSRIEVPYKNKKKPQAPASTVRLVPAPSSLPVKIIRPTKSSGKSTTPIKKSGKTPSRIININRATLDDLLLLPGVGPVMAQAILDYRTENGPFASVDDLDKVKGIGPKKLEKLRPWATVD